VDKIKNPGDLYDLWNTATADSYRDYSEVFMWDRLRGWEILVPRSENVTRPENVTSGEPKSRRARKLARLSQEVHNAWQALALKEIEYSASLAR